MQIVLDNCFSIITCFINKNLKLNKNKLFELVKIKASLLFFLFYKQQDMEYKKHTIQKQYILKKDKKKTIKFKFITVKRQKFAINFVIKFNGVC